MNSYYISWIHRSKIVILVQFILMKKSVQLFAIAALLSILISSVAYSLIYSQQANSFTQIILNSTNPTWLDGWNKRVKLTLDSNDIIENLTDIPVLVYLGSSAGRNNDDVTFIFDELQTDQNRKKIAITTSDNTQYQVEIEKYNQTNQQAWLWVKVPQVSNNQDTELFLYYDKTHTDNTVYIGDTGSAAAQNVWDANFKAVYHLEQSPSGQTGEIKDSTINSNNATTQGNMNSSSLVDTIIGKGLELDELDDLIRVPNSTSLSYNKTQGTFEMWINWDNPADGDHQIIMTSSNRFTAGATDGFEWASQSNGNHFFYPWAGEGNNYNLAPNPFNNATWHHLVATFYFPTKEAKIYIDGANMSFTTQNVPTLWTSLANTSDWLWGGNPDRSTRYFDGYFDEIRISSEAKNQSWITASYESGKDHLIDYGTQELLNRNSLEAQGGYMIVGDGTPNWGSTTGTISWWIKWDTIANRPWGQHDNMELRVSGSSLIADWGDVGSITSTTNFETEKWYFIAVIWNENTNTLILYVGDQNNLPSIDAQTTSWTATVSSAGVTENNFLASKSGVDPTDGHGDDLRYYNTDRSLASIQSDYKNELTGQESNLKSYFRLNNDFNDSGPNNNHASGSASYVFTNQIPFS